MGKGEHGHFAGTHGADQHHNLTDNLPALTEKFPLSPGGYFGVKGRGKTSVRRIESDAPLATAKKFFDIASEGSIETVTYPKGAVKKTLKDKTHITFRKTSSSDGSPAVDISIESPGRVKNQKIHFIKAKEK